VSRCPQPNATARQPPKNKEHRDTLCCAGLDEYTALLGKYASQPTSYSPIELRACLDSFRDVLFRHLDEEVRDLKAESLRDAGWTLDELRRIPM
jgi:hypothetical protein